MRKGGGVGAELVFCLKESKSKIKKKISWGCRGGGEGEGLELVIFFYKESR